MPPEDSKILQFNQHRKSHKTPFIIYSDLECLFMINVKIIVKIH